MSTEEDRETWTPSTEQVRAHYVFNQSDQWDPERGKAFDRWLASVRTPTPAPRKVTDAAVARFVDEYNAVMLRVLDRDAVLLALTAALGVSE